jgi:glycosyltransferase involved in cell wall biosynthesis
VSASAEHPKVLHLIASLEVGGTEMQLVRFIARSSNPACHHVAVFAAPGAPAERLPHPPIWVGRVSRSRGEIPPSLLAARRLRQAVQGGGFDLVHAHLGGAQVLAAIVTPRGVPIVASRRGRNTGFEANRLLKLVEGFGHRRTSILICNARFWADLARRRDRWTPPTRVIHNGIDLEEFAPSPMPPDDEPRVAVVANLHPYKRHDLFLRSFRLLRDDVPEATATIVGDGVERARLEALAADLGLDRSVTFAGRLADPRPIVAASHLVALTSKHEGFPNALLEAMAQGRPVVATRVGGVPELVREAEDGFLTSSDPAEIAARMRSLLLDASTREDMARSARERASAFTWDRVVRETEGVYREVLALPRR